MALDDAMVVVRLLFRVAIVAAFGFWFVILLLLLFGASKSKKSIEWETWDLGLFGKSMEEKLKRMLG